MKKNAFLNEAGTNPPVNATRTRTMATRAILLLFLIFTSLSAFAQVGDIVVVDGLNYKILTMPDGGNNGTVEVSDNISYAGSTVTIPADITVSGSGNDGTYDVVRIGDQAFDNNKNITTLNLPAINLTTIGYAAFNCSSLTGSLTIPNSVITIEERAFTNCSGFTGSLTIGEKVTTIGNSVFASCSGFTGSLTIPSSVTYIDEGAFTYCSGFTGSLTIGEKVTAIMDQTFNGCSGFTGSLIIPASVTTFGTEAFAHCSGFTGSLTIPSSVTDIGECTFDGCSSFDGSLTIPASVTTFEAYTFRNCSGFTSINSAIQDFSGVRNNAFYGITDKPLFCDPELEQIHKIYGFTNVNLPIIASATPADEAENVSCTTDAISVTFSKAMKTDRGTLTGSPAITGEGEWSDDDKTYTYTLAAALTPETAYTITLTDFMDTGSAALFGNSFSFTTKKTPTISDLAYTIPTGHVYTGTAQGIGTVTAGDDVTGLGAITVKYNGNAAAPVKAGTYAVTVDMAEGADYNAITGLELGEYTMATKAVTITGLTAQDKAYDGTRTATATGGTLSGVIPGDKVSIKPGTATFASAEVGNNITVTFSGYGITGADAANYYLTGQPAIGNANILPPTYGVSTGSFLGGSVSADKTSAQEGETITLTINPDQDYVLDEISAYQTSSPHTVVPLAGSGLTRTFTMPAYGVTVTATFKTQAQVDQETVEAAKAAIEGGTYHVAQATANDEVAVKAWLVTTLDALFGQSHGVQFRSATSTVGDVTVTALTPAVAGTENHPEGSNGSFSFTVALTKEAGAITATVTTGVIVATAFTPQKRIDLSFIDDLTVRILNTGNVTTGELTLALSGANANVFTLPSTRVSSMPVTAYAHVTLTPRAGLADGIYTATLTVSEDGTTLATIDITYTVTTTGLADIPPAKALKAWMQDGGLLHVNGLTAGQPWSVHTISGALVHYNIADSAEATVRLTARGVYIVKSGATVVKTAY